MFQIAQDHTIKDKIILFVYLVMMVAYNVIQLLVIAQNVVYHQLLLNFICNLIKMNALKINVPIDTLNFQIILVNNVNQVLEIGI